MAEVTQSLRQEHDDLRPEIENLRAVADCIGAFSRVHLQRSVDAIYEFLAHGLIPHAEAEEEVLYPAVAKVLGSPQATTTMSRDHVEISRLSEQLRVFRARISQPDFDQAGANELRRLLYGLYAVVKLHLAKEEEIYLPMLDGYLSEADAHELVHKLADFAHNDTHPLGH